MYTKKRGTNTQGVNHNDSPYFTFKTHFMKSIEQAKQELKEKRLLLNKTTKEIEELKSYILNNGGELEKKIDLTDRNYRIWLDKENGMSPRDIATKYNLKEERIRYIYDRTSRNNNVWKDRKKGMSIVAISEKYKITTGVVKHICSKMVE